MASAMPSKERAMSSASLTPGATSKLPWKASLAMAVAFELFTLAMVRDNLTLNVLMLVSPVDAIKAWQAGA